MSVLGVVFFASLAVLFVAQVKRGARVRFFSLVSVPLAVVAYVVVTVLLWKGLAPASLSDSHDYAMLGLVETAWGIAVLGYVATAMILRR